MYQYEEGKYIIFSKHSELAPLYIHTHIYSFLVMHSKIKLTWTSAHKLRAQIEPVFS